MTRGFAAAKILPHIHLLFRDSDKWNSLNDLLERNAYVRFTLCNLFKTPKRVKTIKETVELIVRG